MAVRQTVVVGGDSAGPSDGERGPAGVGKSTRALTERLSGLVEDYVSKKEGRGKLESTLRHLKSKRLRHTASAETFLQHGGLESLLKLSRRLHLESEGDCKLATSIWGTIANLCALNKDIQLVVIDNMLPDISKSLRHLLHSDLLNVLCRTIANISGHPQFPDGSKRHLSVMLSDLTCICSSSTDANCLQSALRCIRKLATNVDVTEDYTLHQTLPLIAGTFKLNNSDVTLAAMDALEVCIASRNLLPSLWAQGHEPLEIINNLVDNPDESISTKAVQLLCQCSTNIEGKAVLSRAGSIDVLLCYLNKCTDRTVLIYKKVVQALCLCCKDVHSRQKMRDNGGLQLLINLLVDSEFESCYEDILSALICYYFDEHTLRYMMKKLGLTRSIVHHLTLMANNIKETSTASEPVSQSFFATNISTPDSLALELTERGSDIYIENDYDGYQSHDESISSSTISLSEPSLPSSSSPVKSFTSEISTDNYNDSPPRLLSSTYHNEELLTDLYQTTTDTTSISSPRDPFDITPTSPVPTDFIDSLLSSPNYYSHSEQTSVALPSLHQVHSDNRLLLLLSRVSHLHDCQTILACQEVLSILVRYSLATGPSNVHCLKVLGRLFSNPHCFQDCLLTLAPSLIFHHMTHTGGNSAHSMCQQLMEKLINVADSPYGQGVIAHLLLRGNSQEILAGTLSLILLERSHAVCYKMLLGYDGLQNLLLLAQGKPVTTSCTCSKSKDEPKDMPSLDTPPSEQNELIQLLSIGTLLRLSHHYFKTPIRKRRAVSCNNNMPTKLYKCSDATPPLRAEPSNYCLYRDYDHYPFDTLVVLDDQGAFPVHRSLLIGSSEVFSIMLSGRYQESSSNEIRLHEIPSLAFQVLVHHMYGCGLESDQCNFETCNDEEINNQLIIDIVSLYGDDPVKANLIKRTLLVAVSANQYFLSSLQRQCEILLQTFLSISNVVSLFEFSQFHHCHYLSGRCVEFLISQPQGRLQAKLFLQLLESRDSKVFLKMIEDLFYSEDIV